MVTEQKLDKLNKWFYKGTILYVVGTNTYFQKKLSIPDDITH